VSSQVIMENICQKHALLTDQDGIIYVPFLVKGKLVLPPKLSRAEAGTAFDAMDRDTHYVKIAQAQLVREPVIDRQTMQYTGEYIYQVLPAIQPFDLIDTDFDGLVHGPYTLSVEEVLQFLQSILSALGENGGTLERVRELSRCTSEHPDVYLDCAFAALQAGLDPQAARTMIDNELSAWTIPGSQFLDGWVEVPGSLIPGVTPLLSRMLSGSQSGDEQAPARTCLRAMPTRQLHITAGNAAEVPWVSALRLILTKSAGVVKLPYGSTLSGGLLALAVAAAAPEHPLTQHLSIVYWQGGDGSVEDLLLAPGAFDRIVVWGAPEAVASVGARATFTKTVCFNPRYGVSLVGREAFSNSLGSVVFAAAMDTMIYSQKACTASLVHYLEGNQEQVEAYSERLLSMLNRWDELALPFVAPAARGQIRRMKRGRFARATWLENQNHGEYTSGVVIMPDEFNILDHPMSRLVVVRRVDDLKDALKYLHQGVSTVGIYPEARRIELRDAIAARGVSSILPLGQCERITPGTSQDGMLVLSELVDWKSG
jgi:hypothetical protein